MNVNLTPKAFEAERVYNHICAFFADNGYPPRRRDIGDDLGISIQLVDRALMRLRGAGRIYKESLLPIVYTKPPP